jgi:hypothetical protein
MEQDPLLLQSHVDGMDVVVADRMEVLKKKDGPSNDPDYFRHEMRAEI